VKPSLDPRAPVGGARIAAVVLAYTLAAVQFLATMNLLIDVIHLMGGLVAFGALMGLVALGIVALSFVIAIPSYYATGARRRAFLPRVLAVTGMQGFLFAALHLFRYLASRARAPRALDFLIGGAGLAAGIVCSVLASRGFAAAKRLRQAPANRLAPEAPPRSP
jgi:hypothetical protein